MTRKMRLDPDQLTVESFATAAGASTIGTVHGHATAAASCPGNDTCDQVGPCAESAGACTTHYCDPSGSCLVMSCVESCALTCEDNCQPSVNEIGTCNGYYTCNPVHTCDGGYTCRKPVC